MICPQCGLDVISGSAFCHKCGARLDEPGSPARPVPPAKPVPADLLRETAQAKQANADEPERELWQGGYSGKDMVGAWLGAAGFTLLCAVGGFLLGNVLGLAAGIGVAAVVWLALLGWLVYLKLGAGYRLTSQRLIHQTGILVRTTNRIEVIDMDDVTYTQSLVQRLMGTGTITIHSSDTSHPKLVMPGIESVRKIADLIDDTRRLERRRRGLHIEAI